MTAISATVVTEQLIEEWKKKHGEVFEFEAEDGKKCWFRKPDRETLRACNLGSGDDTIKWNEILVKNCFLGGDEEFKTQDDYFFGLSTQLAELIKRKQVQLKKTY